MKDGILGDVHSKEVRSYNMSRIKGKNTKPEELVRKYLFAQGFRYRKNDSRLPGKPDIVLPKYRTIILVNGCFWHHHECIYFRWPESNADFWRQKINRNVERDQKNIRQLEQTGWHVIVVWECELKKEQERTLSGLANMIKNNQADKE